MENQMIREKLKKKLKEQRYEHTIGVMYTAASLAMCHGADMEKALLAGLLHDCGKYGTGEEQIRRCFKHQVELSDAEIENPALVHAKLGAYYAKSKYEVEDPEILNAILYHTTGHPEMTLLEKIIYIADYIEPGRKQIPGLEQIRRLAFHDLDQAVCLCSEHTLHYLHSQGKRIDPATVETYEYYRRS